MKNLIRKIKNKKQRKSKHLRVLGDITGGAVTIITGAKLTGAIAKVI